MNQLYIFIVIVFLSIKSTLSIAQSFNYVSKTSSDDIVHHGIEFDHHYYFLMSSGNFLEDVNPIEYELLGYKNYLLKFDKSFNIIDSVGFDSISNYNTVYFSSKLKNDTLVLLGEALTSDISDGQVAITKFSLPSLELISTEIYGKTDVYELPTDFYLEESGEIIVVSKDTNFIIQIMKISNSGELLMYKNDTTLLLPWATIIKLPLSPEYILNSPSATVVFDSTFQNYEKYYYSNAGIFRYHGKHSIFNDSSYFIAGRQLTQPPLSPSFDISYFLMNGDNNFIDSGFIYLPDTMDASGTINVINNNDILYGGTHNVNWTQFTPAPFEEEYRWMILRNEDIMTKETNWSFSFGGDANYLMRDSFITENGSIIVYGTRYDWENTDIWQRDVIILEVDTNGVVVSTNTNDEIAYITVYPNPGNSFFKYRVAAQYPQSTFELYDINGNLIKRKEINGKWGRVETTFLPTGSYVYKIYNSQGLYETGKWVKE